MMPRKPRAYRMGRCPKCRRLHRLPLSADPAKALCKKCFWPDIGASLDRIAAMVEQNREIKS